MIAKQMPTLSFEEITRHILKTNSLPLKFDQWEEKDFAGNTIAHWTARYHLELIPKKFNFWLIENDDKITPAHWAAMGNRLPLAFPYWEQQDINGDSVAHYAAKSLTLPQRFNKWHLKNNNNVSVAAIVAESIEGIHFLIENKFKDWHVLNAEKTFSIFSSALRKGFIPADDFPCWNSVVDSKGMTCLDIWEEEKEKKKYCFF